MSAGGTVNATFFSDADYARYLALLAEHRAPMERFPDLAERIAAGEDEAMSARLRRTEPIGRPVGDAASIAALERQTGRSLAPLPPGPKPKDRHGGEIGAPPPQLEL